MAIAYRSSTNAYDTVVSFPFELSISKPSGTAEDDVLILAIVGDIEYTPICSGFTLIDDTEIYFDYKWGYFYRLYTLYKVAGSSEPSTYTVDFTGGTITDVSMGLTAFSGCDTTDPIGNTNESNSSGTSVDPGAITIQAVGNMALHISGTDNSSMTTTPPTGTPTYTEDYDYSPTGCCSITLSYATYTSTGTTGSKAATNSISDSWGAHHIELQTAETPPPSLRSYSLHYYKDGTFDIPLWNLNTDMTHSVGVYSNSETSYAELTTVGAANASDLMVRKGGVTYAFVTDSTSAPPVTSSYIEIQRGEYDIGNTSETDAPGTTFGSMTSAFVLNKSNRFCTAGTSSTNSTTYYIDDISGRIELTDTDEITFTRLGTGDSNDFKFNWESWEYKGDVGGANEFIVRHRGTTTVSTSGTSVTSFDDTPDDIERCIPFITGISNTDNGSNSNGATAYAVAVDDGGTPTVFLERGGSSGTTIVQWVLVEFTGSNWTLGFGYQTATSADNGAMTLYTDTGMGTPLTLTSTSNAFVAAAYSLAASGDTDDAIADNWPLMRIASTTTVDWDYDAQHAATNSQLCYVLYNPEITVTEFNADISNTAGWSNVDITSAGLTDISKAAVFGTSVSSGTGTAFARGWRNYKITSTTNVSHYCHRSGNTMQHYIAIVDFSAMS